MDLQKALRIGARETFELIWIKEDVAGGRVVHFRTTHIDDGEPVERVAFIDSDGDARWNMIVQHTPKRNDAPVPPRPKRHMHPKYGEALSGAPTEVAGVVFRAYSIGRLKAAWCSDDARCEIWCKAGGMFSVVVDGEAYGKRFHKPTPAMLAAVKLRNSKGARP